VWLDVQELQAIAEFFAGLATKSVTIAWFPNHGVSGNRR
jgi:hypothetical protein